jgi:hypothetical protein
MKVEIITLHNVKNYGSVLQTYVTQQVLKELGYDSEVIDYYREDLIEKNILQNRLNSSSIFSKNIITRMIGRIFIKKDIKNQSKKFNKFISQYLKITPKSYYSNEELKEDLPKADIYCTGSDQVWNGEWNNGIEKAFFLDFVPDDMPKIAYSASFGRKELKEFEEKEVTRLLNRYKMISVREKSGLDILNKIGYKNAENVLDPTLMYNREQWKKFAKETKYANKKYILVYQLNTYNPIFDQYIKNLSKKKKLPVFRLSSTSYQFIKYGKLIYCPEVEEFISYFLNAEYIVTDSFHATAFAINLNKKFACIFPKKFSERLNSILQITGLESKNVTETKSIEAIDEEIDYERVNSIIEKERKKSFEFLKKELGACYDKK